MKRLYHPRRLYFVLWYGLAATVIASAVLLSTARLLLPSMQGYRTVVQDLASDFIGQPVSIGGMDAELIGLSPAFIFHDVALAGAEFGRPLVRARELRVELDLTASLYRRQPVLRRLLIGGAELTVERAADGGLGVSGLPASTGGGGGNDFGDWLLTQPDVAIRQSRLTWRDPQNERVYRFDDIDLSFRNRGQRHRLSARLRLPESMGRELNVALDVQGDPREPGAWDGEVYLAGDGLLPAEWLAGRRPAGIAVAGGRMTGALWSSWRGGRPVAVEGTLSARELAVANGERTLRLDRAGGDFRWQTTTGGWRLLTRALQLERGGRAWPATALDVQRQGEEFQLLSDFLRVEDLVAMAALAPPLAAEQTALLRDLAPAGDLRRVRLTLTDQGLEANAEFVDLAMQPWHGSPGFEGLDGRLLLRPDRADVALDSRDGQVKFPDLFRAPLPLQRLAGRVSVQRVGDGWQVQGREVRLANADIEAELALEMALPDVGMPYVDLRGRFADGRAVAVPGYLPVHIMAPATVAWLDQAFKAGHVVGGTVLLRGPVAAFPFRRGEGVFEVRFDAEGVELAYQKGWPHLTDLAAEVTFRGESMVIAGRNGRFFDGRISAADVRIPNLRKARLVVDGQGDLSGGDVLRTLRETPLATRFGRTFRHLSADGTAGLVLHLEIPLRAGDPKPLAVNGELAMAGTRLRIGERLTVSELDGVLRFDDGSVSAEPIQARMFDAPVELAVVTRDAATIIQAHGGAEARALERELTLPFAAFLSGRSQWHASLSLPHAPGGATELRVSSSLDGLTVGLPEPLAKPAAERRELIVRHLLSGAQAGFTELYYGEVLRSAFLVDDGGGLDRGTFHFGAQMSALPEERLLRISGALLQVEPGKWRRVLSGNAGGAGGGGAAPLPIEVALHRLQIVPAGGPEKASTPGPAATALPPLDVTIGNLEWGDQRLGELQLKVAEAAGGNRIDSLRLTGRHYRATASGRWQERIDGGSETRLDVRVRGKDAGEVMKELGFASVITDGAVDVGGSLYWEGSPGDFAVARLNGRLKVEIQDGTVEDVDPGGGRLLGLFSLQALPRRLILDFSDLFAKGMQFRRIDGDLRIADGQLWTDNLAMDAPSAHVVVAGRTGLASEDYDLLVTVVPNVADSIAVAGGIALGPQTGAVLWLVQKLLGLDKAGTFQYTVEGSWQDPKITRLPRPQPDDPSS